MGSAFASIVFFVFVDNITMCQKSYPPLNFITLVLLVHHLSAPADTSRPTLHQR